MSGSRVHSAWQRRRIVLPVAGLALAAIALLILNATGRLHGSLGSHPAVAARNLSTFAAQGALNSGRSALDTGMEVVTAGDNAEVAELDDLLQHGSAVSDGSGGTLVDATPGPAATATLLEAFRKLPATDAVISADNEDKSLAAKVIGPGEPSADPGTPSDEQQRQPLGSLASGRPVGNNRALQGHGVRCSGCEGIYRDQ